MKEIRFMVTYEVGEIVYDRDAQQKDKVEEIQATFTKAGVSLKYKLEKRDDAINASWIIKEKVQ